MNWTGDSAPCNMAPADLEAFFDGNLSDDALRINLESHVTECPACRAQIHALTALRDRLRTEVRRTEAPPYLRREVEDTASGRRRTFTPRATKRFAIYAAAAGLSIAVGLGIWAVRPPLSPDLAMASMAAFIEDHAAYVRGPEDKEKLTGEIADLETWLTDKLDFSPRLPQWEGASLLSGRPCSIHGRRVALVRYRIDGHEASLYIQVASTPARSDGVRMKCVDDFHVAVWRQHNLNYVLVAPGEVDHLCNQLALNAATPGRS